MTSCRWEADVLRAARDDQWPDNLRRHLTECEECANTAAVAPWMAGFARISERTHRLPDPSIVWLKAKLMQGTADASRASRPMTVAHIVSYLVVAAGWTAVLMWKAEALQNWLRTLSPTAMLTKTPESLSLSFFAIVFVLMSVTVMLALHTVMGEE